MGSFRRFLAIYVVSIIVLVTIAVVMNVVVVVMSIVVIVMSNVVVVINSVVVVTFIVFVVMNIVMIAFGYTIVIRMNSVLLSRNVRRSIVSLLVVQGPIFVGEREDSLGLTSFCWSGSRTLPSDNEPLQPEYKG